MTCSGTLARVTGALAGLVEPSSGRGGGSLLTTWIRRERWPFAEELDASLAGDLAGMLRGPVIDAAHAAENPVGVDIVEVNERRRGQ
jgi:hypothetical protein